MSVFVTEMLNLHRGQGQDILWREQCTCPTGIYFIIFHYIFIIIVLKFILKNY